MKNRQPYLELKGWMASHDITQIKMAEVLGTTPSYVNKKINGTGPDFKLSEARKLATKLKIPIDIFFAVEVPIKERKCVAKK